VVSRERRYLRTAEEDEFFATVLETSQSRRLILPPGTILWRAQIGNDWEVEEDGEDTISIPCGFPPERMKPLAYEASEGRANPKGIPVLYMATRRDTAVAEVRPWVGLLVSVAQLKVLRSLELVNCAAITMSPIPKNENRLSGEISTELSRNLSMRAIGLQIMFPPR
jgi:hypothetical protein